MAEHIRVSGPFFDGRAVAALHAWMHKAEEDVARLGQTQLRHLGGPGVTFKTYTGNWQGNVQYNRAGEWGWLVHDDVVYTDWLEGVSERNQATRFKGYHLFRQVASELRRRAGEIARATLPPFIRIMN